MAAAARGALLGRFSGALKRGTGTDWVLPKKPSPIDMV